MSGNKDTGGGWRNFVWNSEKKEFLGRTGGSWFKIFLFYVIFYGCLAGIFVGTIQAMLLTLSDYKPTYQDRVAPPGLSHTPRSEKSEISFKMSDKSTYEKYVESMNKLLEKYDEERQRSEREFEDCGDIPEGSKFRGLLENSDSQKKVCRFRRTLLSACDGVNDKNYGFPEGRPCIIVKLNRIVNFIPKPSNKSLPEDFQGVSNDNVIPIRCKNKREEDKFKIGEIKYYGIGEGFPLQYYPYYGKRLQPQYLQPLVAIKFMNISKNEELRIECKVVGENIDYSEKDRYQGRFDIKMTVNS